MNTKRRPAKAASAPPAPQPDVSHAHARRIAALLFALATGLYVRTLAPGLLGGDAGEFHFAAWAQGLAHPTGYPLYLMLGGLWQRGIALFGGDPAWALNLFGAVTQGGVVAGVYLLARRWMGLDLAGERGPWVEVVAVWTALLFAFNPTAWSQAVIAEVYPLHALFIVAILWAAHRLPASPQSPNPPIPQSPIPNTQYPTLFPHATLALLLGLALTHHRTSLFLIPGVLGLLFWLDRGWWRRGKLLAVMAAGIALPQLLYAYIPLRSGPDASPWLYQALNGETLVLYEQSWRGFIAFITGSVFAVSFLDLNGALARLPQMGSFWLIHFSWTGLLLMGLGILRLMRRGRWPLVWLTLPFVVIHQIFNLFYGIGDIHVYYITLYLVAALWAGFGLIELLERTQGWRRTPMGLAVVLAMTYFVIAPLVPYYAQVDQSTNRVEVERWGRILGSPHLPADALLVTNDRDEMVPLYYYQAVKARAQGVTGLFPLITQEPRFADVGGTVQTALDAGSRPVYLIKPMPGLDIRFDLAEVGDDLVRVDGPVTLPEGIARLDRAYGPLTLLGYAWQRDAGGDSGEMTLFWRVEEAVSGNFTTTVQLFAGDGERLAQADAPPGGPFYPTSLWKPGEILRERHTLSLSGASEPVRALVALYRQPAAGEGEGLIYLAEAVEWAME